MSEEWKVIDGYEGRYAVSNEGNVRREKLEGRDGRATRRDRPLHSLLTPNPDRYGYLRVQLWNRKTKKRDGYAVHQLVATYFIGPCPPDKDEVNHVDGNKGNNHVENLEWMTHQENCQHSYDELGRQAPRGSKAGMAKLTESDIPKIRALLKQGKSHRAIAEIYGVSHPLIGYIRNGKIWSHVE